MHLRFQRKLQDDLDEVNNKWRGVKDNLEKFEDDTKEKLENEKRKVGETPFASHKFLHFTFRTLGIVTDSSCTPLGGRIPNRPSVLFPGG